MDASLTTDRIAKRERCSLRKVNMTISLAFLAPDLVKAASLLPGNGILPPETNVCKRPSKSDLTFAETDRSHTTAPIRGVSTKGRKISVRDGWEDSNFQPNDYQPSIDDMRNIIRAIAAEAHAGQVDKAGAVCAP
jgi:hypothetical protein